MDQRSGAGRFSGWIKILAINWGWGFPSFSDVGRENCFCIAQDHPEFPLQEEGQSRGAESPKRGPVPTRKTDRLHDLTTIFEWLAHMTQYWIMLIYSLLSFMTTMFRNSIQTGTKFYYQRQKFHPMMSWKVCTNEEYVSPRNPKPCWYCTTRKFIKRYRCPTIKSWRPWWRDVQIRTSDYETLTPEIRELRLVQWLRVERDYVVFKKEKELAISGKQ